MTSCIHEKKKPLKCGTRYNTFSGKQTLKRHVAYLLKRFGRALFERSAIFFAISNEKSRPVAHQKICTYLKVSKFQIEFMKSSFLPKYEQKIVRISALLSVVQYRAEILTIFRSYFGRNDDFINSFWNLLTFSRKLLISCQGFKVVIKIRSELQRSSLLSEPFILAQHFA